MTPPSESTSGLVELEKRLEQASGPDRALDYAICIAFAAPKVAAVLAKRQTQSEEDAAREIYPEAAHVTSSIDDALTLVSRVLSKHRLRVFTEFQSDGLSEAEIRYYDNGNDQMHLQRQAYAPTPPLAICTALIRALKASVP